MTALAEAGIHLKRDTPGEHRAPCPECDRGPRDDALAVKVEPEGSATWCCHRCGWAGAVPPPGEARRNVAGRRAPLRRPEPKASPTGFSGYAAGLFREGRAVDAGSPAGRYLIGRGCALPPVDGDLRWHPTLRHPDGHVGPGLLALVTDALTAEPRTLHRTWLAEDGSGKAAIEKPRLLLKGHGKAGGVVRLWPDDEVATGLCIAEGLETALSAAVGFRPVWACLDAANLAAFPVLPGIEALTIMADHDTAGLKAARACAERWLEAGREVRVWKAPAEGQDFNDFVGSAAA